MATEVESKVSLVEAGSGGAIKQFGAILGSSQCRASYFQSGIRGGGMKVSALVNINQQLEILVRG